MNAITRCLDTYWSSSIGKKLVVAITGIVLVLFLAGHLSGNLLMYVGREAFNEYAHFLHTALHGAGVWIARIVLLTMLVLRRWSHGHCAFAPPAALVPILHHCCCYC